ncbi:hypothetical protein [Cytobacillus oceanisediminis]|uniref:hypothetical protein n=1 Tax=Cytobacillus oceanisediminis TaxID=665099 RepID=UPI00203E3CB3|nr:hypothetical protein [Cytobacillus oceanisediminis]MCM3402938.1 hypothetical protein [Cytobacillus oceanisediminis]
MYTYRKIKKDTQIILVLVITIPELKLINFCTVIRAKYMWKSQIIREKKPYTPEKLNKLKSKYQEYLIKTVQESNIALVDISSGEIIRPNHKVEVLDQFNGLLPF